MFRTAPGVRDLVKEVLPPLRIALSEHTHEVATGVQTEWARLPQQLHAGFIGRAIALAIVAGIAAGHQVLPRRFSGARTRNHVIQRELRRGERLVTVLARVAIAHQDVLTREGARL